MLTVISPAKSLDFDSPVASTKTTKPRFLAQSQQIIDQIKHLAPQDIAELMKLSDKLAILNYDRFQEFETPFTKKNARACVFAFRGDVYQGLDADTLTADDLDFSQNHLRILSGLYGVLRPLDLMQAYRLEMGTKFENELGKNLYEFWGETLKISIQKELDKSDSQVLVNLASNEYFKAIKAKQLSHPVITPVFKDYKNGQYKIISFFAKKARGLMARYIIQNKIDQPEGLK
ncbi:MAG: peroxide stress protein YaaA, partial [Kangiellaceae bacterium]|nr:peroxide stress protein YaaA [Kangiellaceae bacterium]